MSAVLFFDPVCQRPYDTQTLTREAMGGTEASVTRIADSLGAFVMQHNRSQPEGRYLPPGPLAGIEQVVLVRDSRALPHVRRLFPGARFHLWIHDQLNPGSKRGRRLARVARLLRELPVGVVCVSDTQRRGVEATLRRIGVADRVVARTIYNPVDEALRPSDATIDESKLVFFSSPNKGLGFTLDAFRALRRRMPDLRLLVGNPGYKLRRPARIAGVEYLGALPQPAIHAEVRTALCTFFPNFVIPETFGLVFAESNALGTPVLTHDCGAAAEIIDDARQILPLPFSIKAYEACVRNFTPRWRYAPARIADAAGLFDPHIERIRAWRLGGRPSPTPDPRFQLGPITARWRETLGLQ